MPATEASVAKVQSAASEPAATAKRKRKNRKKRSNKKSVQEEAKVSAKAENALLYLRSWAAREDWKFKKAQQVFLLKNGLSMDMTDEDFATFCDYMSGLTEGAKDALRSKARQLIQSLDLRLNRQSQSTSDSESD